MTTCSACVDLAAKTERLEAALSAALDDLEAHQNIASAELRKTLRDEAAEARLDYEIGRLELEQHKLTHLK